MKKDNKNNGSDDKLNLPLIITHVALKEGGDKTPCNRHLEINGSDVSAVEPWRPLKDLPVTTLEVVTRAVSTEVQPTC